MTVFSFRSAACLKHGLPSFFPEDWKMVFHTRLSARKPGFLLFIPETNEMLVIVQLFCLSSFPENNSMTAMLEPSAVSFQFSRLDGRGC